jgi:hypothetical protein
MLRITILNFLLTKTHPRARASASHAGQHAATQASESEGVPWVKTATHLGHELSHVCNMKCKRGEGGSSSPQVSRKLLEAVRTYSCSLYNMVRNVESVESVHSVQRFISVQSFIRVQSIQSVQTVLRVESVEGVQVSIVLIVSKVF